MRQIAASDPQAQLLVKPHPSHDISALLLPHDVPYRIIGGNLVEHARKIDVAVAGLTLASHEILRLGVPTILSTQLIRDDPQMHFSKIQTFGPLELFVLEGDWRTNTTRMAIGHYKREWRKLDAFRDSAGVMFEVIAAKHLDPAIRTNISRSYL